MDNVDEVNDAGRTDGDRTKSLADAISAALSPPPPDLAVVLGSGLGGVSGSLRDGRSISAAELPHFPVPTVPGHQCDIHAGFVDHARVIVITGRVHFYEGHSWNVVTRPVRALAALGPRALILSNTAGSTSAALPPGSILTSRDVFHWMGARLAPPGGVRNDRGARPEAVIRVEESMTRDACTAAAQHGITLRPGVLAAGLGPTYETAAEVTMLRRMGADALTMSTVPEFGAAKAAGLPVMIFTVITNYATGIRPGAHLTHHEVTERGARAARDLSVLIAAVAAGLA